MNSTVFRRFGAVVGAAVVVTTITTTSPSTAKVDEGNKDRPCFMIRSNWNQAEGPQPMCRIPMWQQESSATPAAPKRPSNGHPTRGVYFAV